MSTSFLSAGILISNRCTARCSICCTNSSPDGRQTLSRDQLARIYDEFLENGIRKLGFSGGEPFLFYDLLLDSLQPYGNRFQISINTNCFWAANEALALEKLIALKNRGLRKVGISIDSYHLEFVPLRNIRHVLKAAREAEIMVDAGCVSCGDRAEGLDTFLRELPDDRDGVTFQEVECLPIGRAASMAGEVSTMPIEAPVLRHRCTMMNTLVVDSMGDVYPCCSQGGFSGMLRSGNLLQERLSDILFSMAHSSICADLALKGPMRFYEALAQRKECGKPMEDRFVNLCHLCHYVLTRMEQE